MVIDRLVVGEAHRDRMATSLGEAMRQGRGTMLLYDYGTEGVRYYSRNLMCPTTGIAFEEPEPHTFSFNSPKGACPECNGLGERSVFDIQKIAPDLNLSLREGAVEPLGKYHNNLLFAMLEMLGHRHDFTLDDPLNAISKEGLNAILYGDSEPLAINMSEFSTTSGTRLVQWMGVSEWIMRSEDE
jgi:excinuclease ABC subunit A